MYFRVIPKCKIYHHNIKEPEPPKIKRITFASDSTPEAKILSLFQNQNGGIAFFDEFKAELEKSNDNPSYKALKTSMFDGEVYDKELVNRGSIILKHPCISEVGLITKQWLLEAIQKNDIASGFLARYLISFNERTDFKPLEAKELGFCDILEFSDTTKAILNNLGFEREAPLIFKLDSTARSFYQEWFNEYSKSAYDTETDEELTTSYRLSTYALKIALISQIFNESTQGKNICDSAPLIKLEYLQEAIYIISLFRDESDKLLKCLKANDKIHFEIDSISEKLIKKIKASHNGEITRSQALNVRGMNAQTLDEDFRAWNPKRAQKRFHNLHLHLTLNSFKPFIQIIHLYKRLYIYTLLHKRREEKRGKNREKA